MVKKSYDVIIVGAGVSGLMLAKLLNNSKLNVLLVEKRKTIKKLENSRFGTFSETVKKFNLEKHLIKKYKNFGFLYGRDVESKFKYGSNKFSVVDMNSFAKKLKLNCDVKLNSEVKTIFYENDQLNIKIKKNKYSSKILVDCSGENKIISKQLGFVKKNTLDFHSLSLDLENCHIKKQNDAQFIANLKYSNSAFWFYPYSKTKCQIGHTEWFTKKPAEKKQRKKLLNFIKKEEPFKTWFKNSKIKHSYYGVGPAATLNKRLTSDNFISCGNASGAGTPAVGEGFRISLEMAKSAYEVIISAFNKNKFSSKNLIQHDLNFKNGFGKYYIWSNLIRKVVLNYFTEKEYGLFIKRMKNLTNHEFYLALKSEINFKIFRRMINIKLIYLVIKNMFKK